MFNFKYTTFISMEVRHSYYSNAHAADVEFIPLPSTLSLLEAYSLKTRQAAGTLLVYQKRDENDQPFVEIDNIIDLYFLLQVKTDLLNITTAFGKGRYWLSNLKEDGSYQQDITLTAANELPEISGQLKRFYFPPDTVTSITLKRAAAPGGWTFVSTTAVDENSGEASVAVKQPGLYLVEKSLKAGGTEVIKMIFSDELMKQPNSWAVLHLQVKPGDGNLAYTLTLEPLKSKWQYYVVESLGRINPDVNAAALTISYSATSPSRYPATMDINKKAPADYSPAEQRRIEGIKTSGKVKEVYLFESQSELEILDGAPPQVQLHKDGGEKVWKIAVPDRSMKNTTIIYKL